MTTLRPKVLGLVIAMLCILICACARYPSIPKEEEIKPAAPATQPKPPPSSAKPFSPQQLIKEDYRIGSEDVLDVKVWGHDDLSRSVPVSQRGDFSFPLIGDVKAAGRTISQVEKDMAERLADGYIVKPQVTVIVKEYRSQKVYVVGEVASPGTFQLTGPTSVVEILSLAGGPTNDAGTEVLVIRSKETARKVGPLTPEAAKAGEVFNLDLRAIEGGDVSHNVEVKDGDTIMVPKAKYFYVFGEVKNPGQFKYEEGITVLKAITIAGGITEKAAGKRTRIVREKAGVRVEIPALASDTIRPDDIVMVPESFF
jgi:polysaccharide export outer membrane protein